MVRGSQGTQWNGKLEGCNRRQGTLGNMYFWQSWQHGRHGIQVTFNHGWRSGRARTHSIIRSNQTRFIQNEDGLHILLYPGYGETSSNNMVRHRIAEKGVYGMNQKINTIPVVQMTVARKPPAMMRPFTPRI